MKKLFVAICVAFISIAASAQIKGDLTAGVHAVYGDKIETLGFGVDVQYCFTDQIRIDGGWTYWLKKNDVTTNALDANLHYLFNLGVQDKLYAYPLAGLNYTKSSFQGHSDGEIGINLGGGVQYALQDNLDLRGEVKYILGDLKQVVIGAGVIYHF